MDQLQTLVDTLQIQEDHKRDYVVPRSSLLMLEGNLRIAKALPVIYKPTAHFHDQVSEKLKIPRQYYRRMQDSSLPLLDSNVNHWLHSEQKNVLVRTYENYNPGSVARALMSDKYSIMDNFEVLFEALEALKKTGIHIEIQHAEVSDTRMYLKIVAPEIEIRAHELLKNYIVAMERGDGVMAGFVLTNSEVGKGALHLLPRAVIVACQNGLIRVTDNIRKMHLGGRMEEFFEGSDKIRRANTKLIKEQVKFAIERFLNADYLNNIVNWYTLKGNKNIEAPVIDVVQVVASKYEISDVRKSAIMNYFVRGGDTRRIGLVNAITQECQGLSDPDLRHDSEIIAHDLLSNFEAVEAQAFRIKPTVN